MENNYYKKITKNALSVRDISKFQSEKIEQINHYLFIIIDGLFKYNFVNNVALIFK